MGIEFPVRKNLRGPIYLLGTSSNPYAGLEKVNGSKDADPIIRDLAESARRCQQQVSEVLAVLPGRVHDHDPARIQREVKRTMDSRLRTPTEGCFLIGDKGEDLFMGHRTAIKLGMFQTIGAFGSGVTDGLESRRQSLRTLPHRLLEAELPSIELGGNDLLIEMGAGADIGRISSLDSFAKEQGARLVCQDPIPAAARFVHLQQPSIPYIASPHPSQLLGEAFNGFPGRKVIALNNVLSSMAFGQVEEFALSAEVLKADMVSISQSLGLAKNSNMIPEGYHASESGREEMLVRSAIRAGVLSTDSHAGVVLLSFQFDTTVQQILMELAYRTLELDMPQAGLPYQRRSILEAHEDLSPEESRAYITRERPALLMYFRAGQFNTLSTSPFNEVYLKEEGVPKGCLRLKAAKTVVQFSKKPFGKGLAGTESPLGVTLTPASLRDLDPRYAQHLLLSRLSGIQGLPPTSLVKEIQRFAKHTALDFVGRFLRGNMRAVDRAMKGREAQIQADFS